MSDRPAPEDRQRLSDTQRGGGLECRSCGCRHFHVIRTRRDDGVIERRRQCRACGQRITTRETIFF